MESVKSNPIMTVSIDPKNVTKYDRTDIELQLFWIFCIMVAGKNADVASKKITQMFSRVLKEEETPFQYMKENRSAIHNLLVVNRIGQYTRIENALQRSIDIDLRTCTLDDLLKIPGVGNKTSRFFLLHTRRDCQHVILDVHVLRFLREQYFMEVPESTPTNDNKYKEIERVASELLRIEFPHMTLAEIDMFVWLKMSGRLNNDTKTPMIPFATEIK